LALRIGSQFGSYEITALLGKGGMGEVYRAHDSRLKRDVAIKILPEEFTQDPDRVSRFQREAEALAALNHQNIGAIYDIHQSEKGRFLVLEFVEGDTLADLLTKRGKLAIDEALGIAKQICDALDAAHDKGLVHRDLKPANVKVMADGKVKVLDFGLAKALAHSPSSAALSNSPTISMAATNAGIVLGTAAYMAPEQAKGREVDRRADIFAFGCVLFEMLTGRPAFEGDDLSEILGAVLKSEPDWSLLPAATPAPVQRVLRRALKKDLRHRLSDIRDVRIEIEDAGAAPADAAAPDRSARRRRMRTAVVVIAALLIVALAIPASLHLRETPPSEMRLQIVTPPTTQPFHFALSPDGRHLVFVASVASGPDREGRQQLWLRPLDKADALPMSGTEGAEYPFWSADSRSIGYFASGKLYRIDIAGGPPLVLASVANGRGGTWNAEGVILFGGTTPSPIWRIAAAGGEPVPLTQIDPPRQTNHRMPYFLPDGRHFLFHSQGSEGSGVYLGSLEGGKPKRLTSADANGIYLAPDRLVFLRQSTLMTQRMDVARGELLGDPVRVADAVGSDSTFFIGGFSVSTAGQIAYRAGGASRRQLTWYDRTGKQLGVAAEADATLFHPELSPDERRIAVQRTVQQNADIWLIDLVRGGITPFTFDKAPDNFPLWSPDGSQIVFASARTGPYNLYIKPASAVAEEKVLLETPESQFPQDWSADGRSLLYAAIGPKTGRDLWVMDMNASASNPQTRRAVVNTPAEERLAQFDPSGRWIAYETNASGQFEIVVQPFPDPGGKWQVSTNGGTQPRWSADGRELYFVGPDGDLMAVQILTAGGKDPTFDYRAPVRLFSTGLVAGAPFIFRPQYDVSRDGRFLANRPIEETTTVPITLILNWHPETR
jgi:serine/threonine protein kinase